jgi:hypothetical protein
MSWRSWTVFAMTSFCLVVPLETWAEHWKHKDNQNQNQNENPNYTYRRVVELSDENLDLASRPAINDNGTVVFGVLRPDRQGIFTRTSSGTEKQIAILGPEFSAFSRRAGIDVGEPDINNSDQVAFHAITGGDAGIFVSDGMSARITIVRTGALGITSDQLAERLSMNNSGLVAFSIGGVPALTGAFVGRERAVTGVFVGDGSSFLQIDAAGIHPWVNNEGVVAYATRSDVPILKPGRILTTDGRKIAPVNHNETEFWLTYPSINDSGEVAFQSRDLSTNQLGIFVGSGVPLNSRFIPALLFLVSHRPTLDQSPYIPEAGLYGKLAINNRGTVAFWGNDPIGDGGGVFVGSTVTEGITKVVASGDTVLGGKIELVEFSAHGLNQLDQIVFWAQYTRKFKGQPRRFRGIIVATPRELPPG